MKLAELVQRLDSFGDDLTIYIESEKAWCESSEVLVVPRSKGNDLQNSHRTFKYFLEIDLAKEAVEVWSDWNDRIPTNSEKCNAILYYAENDAYLQNELI